MEKRNLERTAEQKEAMLTALETYEGNIKKAATHIGITPRTHYRWCREDNSYNNAIGSLKDIRFRNAKEKLLETAMLKVEEGNIHVLNKMLDIFYKNFTEEYRLSNLYNDDPFVEEEGE